MKEKTRLKLIQKLAKDISIHARTGRKNTDDLGYGEDDEAGHQECMEECAALTVILKHVANEEDSKALKAFEDNESYYLADFISSEVEELLEKLRE